MNISYEIVQKGQEKYLEYLVPENILNQVKEEDKVAIVAVRDNGDGTRSIVGVIIFCHTQNGKRKLRWLYVYPSERNGGIGGKLLGFFSEFESFKKADVVLCDMQMMDYDIDEMASYLEMRGFKDRQKVPGPFALTRDMIAKSKILQRSKRDSERFSDIVPFSEIDDDDLVSDIAGFLAFNMAKITAEVSDRDISFFYKKGRTPQAMLTVKKINGNYHISFLGGDNKRLQMWMLEAVILKLSDSMDEKERLYVDEAMPDISDWIEKLFGNDMRQKAVRLVL